VLHVPRETGHDPDTGKRAAIALFDRLMGIQFTSIGLPDIIADNGIRLLAEFGVAISNNPPISPHTNKVYKAGTLAKYVDVLVLEIKNKFARDPALVNAPDIFPKDQVTLIKKRIEDAARRSTMEGRRETAVFSNCFPIPRQYSHRTTTFPFDDFPDPQERAHSKDMDMLTICRRLFRESRFDELAKNIFTFNGVGRGGESKFLTYEKMFMCGYFNTLFVQWFQRKELKTNPSGFVVDWEHPELCLFFSLGCYWSLGNGLRRTPGHLADPTSALFRKAKFVFQDLHDVADKSVATKLGATLKYCAPPRVRKYYTVKSMRIGATSLLTWHPAVTYEEGAALGGWSTPSNKDFYVWQYLVAILPAILALAGYPNPRIIPSRPTLDVIFHDPEAGNVFDRNKLPAFLESLYPISLPEFATGGRLEPLLLTVTAVMVMNFARIEAKYQHHDYITKMMSSTRNAELAATDYEAGRLLRHWSKKIKKHFADANLVGVEVPGGNGRMAEADVLAHVNANLSQLIRVQADSEAQLQLLATGVQDTMAHVSDLKAQHNNYVQQSQAQLSRLEQQNNTLSQQLSELADLVRALSTGGVVAGANIAAPATPAASNRNNQGGAPPPPPARNNRREAAQAALARQATEAAAAAAAAAAAVEARAGAPATQATAPARQAGRPPRAAAVAPPAAQPPPPPPPPPRVTPPPRARLTAPAETNKRVRGKRKPGHKVSYVLRKMYEDPTNGGFGPLSVHPKLSDRVGWIIGRVFDNETKEIQKIVRALDLIDCLWTKEERRKSIEHAFNSGLSAINTFESIEKRVKLAVHLMGNPTKATADRRAGGGLLGIGGRIGRYRWTNRLENYQQDWQANIEPPLLSWINTASEAIANNRN